MEDSNPANGHKTGLPTVIYACFILHNYCEIKSNNNCINDDIIQNQIKLEQNMQYCHYHSVADQSIVITVHMEHM